MFMYTRIHSTCVCVSSMSAWQVRWICVEHACATDASVIDGIHDKCTRLKERAFHFYADFHFCQMRRLRPRERGKREREREESVL